MISIIICSRNKTIPLQLKENIANTVGVDYELICIDNSNNTYSIFEAYNKGVSLSKFPFLCFVHEDVLFHTPKWGLNLIKHMSKPNIGVAGVAGGAYVSSVPADWTNPIKLIHIIQYVKKKNRSILRYNPKNQIEPKNAILLDGVFLSMPKNVFQQIKFDENLTGFHGYDYDICFQSISKGYTNIVLYDILIEHFSQGYASKEFYCNLLIIFNKWKSILPLQTTDINFSMKERFNIDKKRANKLIRKMAYHSFESIDILFIFNNLLALNNNLRSYSKFEIYSKIYFAKFVKIIKIIL